MNHSVLLMEDDLDQLNLLAETFSSAGYDVAKTQSASDALEIVKQNQFDLVITDIFVQRNGYYTSDGGIFLIGKLRGPEINAKHPWCKEVPIIAISGGTAFPGQEHLLNTTESVGATLSVAKPIDSKELLKISKDLIDDARTRRNV